MGRLASTLVRLAEAGPQDFYSGDIAAEIIADAHEAGSPLSSGDLSGYSASIHPAHASNYRGARIDVAPGLTAGPTLKHVLSLLQEPLAGAAERPDCETYQAYATALARAYEHRLRVLGDDGEAGAPESCTTHMSVVDGQGNIVVLTQTLLSVFGSRVVLPRTGILMNNGIMWFDPRPGRANSIRAGKRPLSNMCPTVVERDDGMRIGLGASGGRRIMPAVAQLISFLIDYGLDPESAIHMPRIDVSGGEELIADIRLGPEVHRHLAMHHPVTVAANAVYPALFACPNLVAHLPAEDTGLGGAYVMSPWAKASVRSSGQRSCRQAQMVGEWLVVVDVLGSVRRLR